MNPAGVLCLKPHARGGRIADLGACPDPMIRSYLFTQYDESMDFSGKNLIDLLDAEKRTAQKLIPILRDDYEMKKRLAFTRKLRTFDSAEIADEVHEFLDAIMGSFRLQRILLKKRKVIALGFKDRYA
jgi:hypothetical protein